MIAACLRLISLLLLVSATSVAAPDQPDQCRLCHEALGDKPSELFKDDVHSRNGISCAGCHGGDHSKEDMDAAMDRSAGFVGVPKGNAISAMCAGCHSNAATMIRQYNSAVALRQLESLDLSVHGRASLKANVRIAQCTSCHGAHGILPKADPRSPVNPVNVPATCSRCHSNATYMRTYNPALPVDQLEKYRTSVHGKQNIRGDVKVAECASCHGSHDIMPPASVKSKVYPTNIPETCASCHSNARYMRGYGIPSDQFEKYSKSVHGSALLEKNDRGAPACNSCHGNHGATPPGVESISKVCGTCHALNAELFSQSPHKQAFDARRLPECETCHGYHDVVAATDRLLGVNEGAVCLWCHGPDTLAAGYAVASEMRALVDSLQRSFGIATERVSDAEQKGMEIEQAKFRLREVRQAGLEARTKVHSFDLTQFGEVVGRGLTVAGEIDRQATAAIDEYYYRRWGLLIATLVMASLGISLVLFIRRVERKQAGGNS